MKIGTEQDIFFELPKSDYTEQDYEDTVKRILPKYYKKEFENNLKVLLFKKRLYSPIGNVEADLIAFNDDYSAWWVIEVELIKHSFERHVYPQMDKLAVVDYSEDAQLISEYCKTQFKKLDDDKFIELVKMIPPRLMVVVDRFSSDWKGALKSLNVEMMTIIPHINERNKYVYYIGGDSMKDSNYPSSSVRFDKSLKILEVKDLRIFEKKRLNEERFNIEIEIPFLKLHDTAMVSNGKIWLDNHASDLPKAKYILTRSFETYTLEKI
jgi:hypothetical protein